MKQLLVACAALMVMLGCGPVESTDALSSKTGAVTGTGTGTGTGTDDGTALTATADLSTVTCAAGSGTAALAGTVSTTGSVDSVEISAQVDGAAAAQVGLIDPQDFTHDGRTKSASYSVNVPLANGSHQVVLCFTQSGAQGRAPKEVCAAPVTVDVACSSCSEEAPFGDLVGSPSLCNGKRPPHIPVHVKGDFGDAPSLNISGPNGYQFSATMAHSGDSCVYQYNWDSAGNGGAGTYAFAVAGNGQSLSFTAQLSCKSP